MAVVSWEPLRLIKVKLTRVLPQKKVSFDSKAFKEKYPDLYKEFCKESEVAGSLRITVNKP